VAAVPLRRLHPDPGEVTALEVMGSLRPGERAPDGRPHVLANMVCSADGRATLAGKSGGLSGPADRELFHALREQVDAILVGTETLRVERYGPFVREPERRARRKAAGRAPDPLGCVVTRSLRLPEDIPLFADPGSTVAVYTSADVEPPRVAARLEVTRLPAAMLTMTASLELLRADHGARSVLCEGGPTVLGALLTESLVDELFLAVSPRLAGGHGLGIVEGPALPIPTELELAWALESEDALFLRYLTKR
jgi:5-amino-6-(5-phosphoribosylamino)uracil reductase